MKESTKGHCSRNQQGVRYSQLVKRAGVKGECNYLSTEYRFNSHLVDKMEQMLGSYGPSPDGKPYTKNFDPEESPSGMIARSGTYHVRSWVIDDDSEVYAGKFSLFRSYFMFLILSQDWQWYFKLAKEWS